MLNDRQFNIIRDLENTKTLITANTLAKKYNVSLRTIRNDVDQIAYAIQRYDVEFLRIPKSGMRIISREDIHLLLLNDMHNTSFVSLSTLQQDIILSFLFLILPNPITLDYLASYTGLSKATLVNKLQHCDNFLRDFNIKIQSVKHKGNSLIASYQSINQLLLKIIEEISFNVFNAYIFNQFFSKEEFTLIDNCINYISNDLLFTPTNHDGLVIVLAFIIKSRNSYDTSSNDKNKSTESAIIYPNVKKLISYISKSINYQLDEQYSIIINDALLKYTNSTQLLRKDYNTSYNLEKAVHLMVQDSLNYFPTLLEEANELEKNLLMHIYYTINRINANLDNKNPLLSQIKSRFNDVFNTVKEITNKFSTYYPLIIDEDECSYITLYYLNYLEKAKTNKSINAILVCNSGVGATKLLSTKIKNNFPSINIVNTSSYFNLQTNTTDLTGIDVIISTIKLPQNVSIPSIVVSPLLDYEDTVKINSILPSHSPIDDSSQISSFLNEYFNDSNNNIGLLFSEIVVYIYQMLKEIKEVNGIEVDSNYIVGLISHVFMGIDRWANHEYIKTTDFEKMKADNPKEMKIIIAFLAKLEKLLKIYIDPIEATAILRYLCY